MRAIDFILNRQLPEQFRDLSRRLDVKGIEDLMARVAKESSDDYPRVSKLVGDLGRRAAYEQGETLTIDDMKPVLDTASIYRLMDQEVAKAKEKHGAGSDAFFSARDKIWVRYSDELEKAAMKESLARGTNLGYAVASGARGKPAQLKAMITTPGVYADSRGRTVPLFVRRSFGQGLRPGEYMAGTYGARSSVISTKRATAKGGDLGKQLAQAAAKLVVTEDDCGTSAGIDLASDENLIGRVLARPVGNIPAGTVIDKDAESVIRNSSTKRVVVRSPLGCSAHEGICAHCAGADARGLLPPIGESVGITSANAIGEPLAQAALSAKHTAGQASGKKEYTGFKYLNQLVQSPEIFQDRAAVAEADGKVSEIREAPQGGWIVSVGETEHYVHPDKTVKVKVGEQVEAGDELSDGLVDPADMVRLRGLGEGRSYLAARFKRMLDDGGVKTEPIHAEMISRALLDHVVIDDDADPSLGIDALPDDVVAYQRVAQTYIPPENARRVRAGDGAAHNQYLAAPVLHYTIGTRVTPKIAKRIQDAGYPDITVQKDPPPFKSDMIRLRTAAASASDDWFARMTSSYVGKHLQESVVRGSDTNVESNVHWAPRLALGENFGAKVRETGKF